MTNTHTNFDKNSFNLIYCVNIANKKKNSQTPLLISWNKKKLIFIIIWTSRTCDLTKKINWHITSFDRVRIASRRFDTSRRRKKISFQRKCDPTTRFIYFLELTFVSFPYFSNQSNWNINFVILRNLTDQAEEKLIGVSKKKSPSICSNTRNSIYSTA
jgi:hypothetical protein